MHVPSFVLAEKTIDFLFRIHFIYRVRGFSSVSAFARGSWVISAKIARQHVADVYRSYCKFPVSGNPPPHRLRAHPLRTHRVFTENLSLFYKVGRSVLVIRQENPDRVDFFTCSCSFNLSSSTKSRSTKAPSRGSRNITERKEKR